ncbi:type IV pilus modification PilV family protein [Leucobacter sp. W1478]|uniref:type IV pilus modification PilV family protein n=1 Tax=Leucobacter sp. W1478 TaxID=3439065 RepID=UPI003F2A1148
MSCNRNRRSVDAGFSMTELAVAIVVLGIVLVGLFPLVIDSVRLAVQNADVAQANRIVATQLDQSRDELSSKVCDMAAVETQKPLTLAAPDNQKFQADRSVVCGSDRLATVTIRVQALSADTNTIAEATTQVVTTQVVTAESTP